jgi:Ca2+-binding EF-hand superfamily protein
VPDAADEADRDGDGVINEEEFFRVMKRRGTNPLGELSNQLPPSPLADMTSRTQAAFLLAVCGAFSRVV